MSYNKTKTDPVLGKQIHQYLQAVGVETPVNDERIKVDRKHKIGKIQGHFTQIMEIMGLDLEDDSLVETPNRVAKMLCNETMWGLDWEAFPKCTVVENKMRYDEMVIERNITVQSNCEHHFLPIVGYATIAYVPKDKVLGLSKLNRVVEYFAKRPQIQERLTEQVYHALSYILYGPQTNPENFHDAPIAVVIEGKHLCVSSRGVEDVTSSTITSKLGGNFKTDTALRAEFMKFVPLHDQSMI